MNDEQLKRIKQIACEYVAAKTKFANATVVSVTDTNSYDQSNGLLVAVKLALSHSDEEIERLVSDGPPEEAKIKREFLRGDFILNLVVAKDVVVASEWEDMDVC